MLIMLDIIIRDMGYRVLSKTAEAFAGAVHKEIRKFNGMNQPAKRKRKRKLSRPITKRSTSRRTPRR